MKTPFITPPVDMTVEEMPKLHEKRISYAQKIVVFAQGLRERSEMVYPFRDIILPSVCLMMIGSPVTTLAEPELKTPNIIVIVADDLGQGDLGPYGNTRIRTPAANALARNGMVLTNHYASGNVCTPSRAGLLTGRYPIRSGLAAVEAPEKSGWGLLETETTLATVLRDRGYNTFIVGKWGLGEMPSNSPLQHGFDRFYGTPNSNDMRDFALYDGEAVIDKNPDQSRITELFTSAAVSFILEMKNKPFFLYLAYTAPHIPLYPSAAYAGKSNAGRYGDVVEEVDAGLGRIVAVLEEKGILQDTLIIFTSDNGPFFEGHPGPAHGGKGSTWDGGYRVPFIASWPAAIPAGQIRSEISMNIDILPTTAEIVGAKVKTPLDGRSMLSIMQGESGAPHKHLLFFAGEDIVGVRTQQLSLVTHGYFRRSFVAFERLGNLPGFQDSYHLLYDMTNDSDQRYSVANLHPAELAHMQQILVTARTEFEPLRTEARQPTFP